MGTKRVKLINGTTIHSAECRCDECKAHAIKMLRGRCPKGTAIYGIIRSVSRSGMQRTIDFYAFTDNDYDYLTGYIGHALDMRRDKSGALVVGGCGMDMVFHVVHNLSYTLHGMDNHDGAGYERSGYTLRAVKL